MSAEGRSKVVVCKLRTFDGEVGRVVYKDEAGATRLALYATVGPFVRKRCVLGSG
jgi:hypothetical protein